MARLAQLQTAQGVFGIWASRHARLPTAPPSRGATLLYSNSGWTQPDRHVDSGSPCLLSPEGEGFSICPFGGNCYETGIASPVCFDRLPSHISKIVPSTVHVGPLKRTRTQRSANLFSQPAPGLGIPCCVDTACAAPRGGGNIMSRNRAAQPMGSRLPHARIFSSRPRRAVECSWNAREFCATTARAVLCGRCRYPSSQRSLGQRRRLVVGLTLPPETLSLARRIRP